jgi:Na+-driven multidrug efflux pump
VVAVASLYIRIVSAGFASQGFYLVVSSGLNVLRQPLQAAGLSALELFVLAIPLASLGSLMLGIPGVFIGISVSYIITGGIAWLLINRVLQRIGSAEEGPRPVE